MKTKLQHYSGAAAAFLIVEGTKVEAQIQYHNIDPDVYMTGDEPDYILDANFDGEFDLKFTFIPDLGALTPAFSNYGCYGAVLPNYSYCLINYLTESAKSFVVPLELGDPISGGTTNAPAAFNIQYDNGTSTNPMGPWISADDKYMGFVFDTPDSLYFGWVRLQVDVCGYYIKDYAISPNPLTAGGLPEPCAPPAALNVITVGSEMTKLSWEVVDGATSYNVRFRKIGDPDWHYRVIAAPKSFVKLKLLNCATDYEWQVQTDCDGMLSDYSPIDFFTTLPCRLGDTQEVDFTIYPNPASNLLHVNFDNAMDNATMEITDLTGKTMYSLPVNGYATKVDITDLAAGIYFISIDSGYEIQRVQFIKQ